MAERLAKGLRIARTQRITKEGRGPRARYRVPSDTVPGGAYLVDLTTGACQCPDSPRAIKAGELCKHAVAATIAKQRGWVGRSYTEEELERSRETLGAMLADRDRRADERARRLYGEGAVV